MVMKPETLQSSDAMFSPDQGCVLWDLFLPCCPVLSVGTVSLSVKVPRRAQVGWFHLIGSL
jgi:hypothetical protein